MNHDTCNCCHGAECPTHPDQLGAVNTDRELFREGDFYSPSIHVTADGMIGMNVGGHVIVMSLSEWHALAAKKPASTAGNAGTSRAFSDEIYHQ